MAQLVDDAMVRVEREGEDDLRIAVDGGFMSVTEDGVIILAEPPSSNPRSMPPRRRRTPNRTIQRSPPGGARELRALGKLD